VDYREMARYAEDAAARESNRNHGWNHYAVGLAWYRAGRHRRAADVLEAIPTIDASWTGIPMTWPVLAMAYHRLGEHEAAVRWLGRAEQWRGETIRTCVAGKTFATPIAPYWWDWAEFECLR